MSRVFDNTLMKNKGLGTYFMEILYEEYVSNAKIKNKGTSAIELMGKKYYEMSDRGDRL